MLGDTRSELVQVLSVVLGPAQANKIVTDLETVVQDKARQGAIEGTNAALDKKMGPILQQVSTEVNGIAKPLFIGAAVVGGVGVLMGLIAVSKSRKCLSR